MPEFNLIYVSVITGIGFFAEPAYKNLVFYLLIGIVILVIIRFQTVLLTRQRKKLKELERNLRKSELRREDLELKNNNIMDSLVYASYIQHSLLPDEASVLSILPDSFIFYLPKEIVSGDFYWVRKRDDKLFIVAADCTGHGVPGAFMSMIGIELLDKIIIDDGVDDPSDILWMLSRSIRRTFTGGNPDKKVIKDGMDIGLVVIDTRKNILTYSGAFFPLYLIRDNTLTEIKGEKLSVGMVEEREFVNHSFNLEPGDIFYTFSDGYADQFGGPNDKKFMYRRFRHLLLTIHQFPVGEQKEILRDSILTWKGTGEQVDDMMVIGFRPLPSH